MRILILALTHEATVFGPPGRALCAEATVLFPTNFVVLHNPTAGDKPEKTDNNGNCAEDRAGVRPATG
ncbi:MAG: hypothetical protein HBSAPP04_15260 [Ignavibacteriaceae bacterium]|nr:MAG: hypothetical protein HBSAPP04_15260 [Ignavibacteriaceae bacterium]